MANGSPDTLLEAGPEQDSAGPDLRSLLVRGLSRSLGWLVLFTVVGALVGLYFGVMKPNLYASNAKLVLRVGARELISSESIVGSDDEPRVSAPTMFDEIQMLSDVAIFERVARNVGPQEVLRPADPSRDDGPETPGLVRLLHSYQARSFGSSAMAHDCPGPTCTTCLRQATKELAQGTSIVNEFASNVISVSYVSTSPEKAQRITQALAEAFIERHREQFSTQALVETNREKVEYAKRESDEAAAAYVEYVNRNTVQDAEPLSPTYAADLDKLEGELWDAQLLLATIRDRRSSIKDRSREPTQGASGSGPVLMTPNETYENQLELRRNLVAQRSALPPTDTAGAAVLDARIAEVNAGLEQIPSVVTKLAEPQRRAALVPAAVPGGSGTGATAGAAGAPTGTGADLLDEHSLELRVQWLTDRIKEKKSKAEASRKAGLISDQERKELAARRDTAEDRYKKMRDRFSQFEALSAIDMTEGANLRVLQTPTLERDKVGPKRASLLIKGLLAGLLAGALFAIVRQRIDSKLRYPELFEPRYRLPVLGVVPQLATLRRLPKSADGDEG